MFEQPVNDKIFTYPKKFTNTKSYCIKWSYFVDNCRHTKKGSSLYVGRGSRGLKVFFLCCKLLSSFSFPPRVHTQGKSSFFSTNNKLFLDGFHPSLRVECIIKCVLSTFLLFTPSLVLLPPSSLTLKQTMPHITVRWSCHKVMYE